jgi:DNA-binding MarR family transcriptional regulator
VAEGTSIDRTANLLGALALAIADRTADAVGGAGAAARSTTGAAALSALLHFLESPSIDLLRRVLGLTSSGTVRLVDRLEGEGLVRRRGSEDGRVTTIELTAAGRRAAERIACARGEVLDSALADLDGHQREALDELLGTVLVGLIPRPGPNGWMCRLCDTDACGREQGRCPVANATGHLEKARG